MKRVLFLVISMIAAMSVFSFVKQVIGNEKVNNLIAETPPPEVMCYDVVEVEPRVPELYDLKDQLSNLEKLYADKKIDKPTYETRKADLLKQIEALNK